MRDLSARLHRTVTDRTSGPAVGVMRVGIGLACVAKLGLMWVMLQRMSDPAVLRMPYPYGPAELPGWFGPAVMAVWFVAALAFTVGWRTGWAGVALCAAMAAALLADQQLYSNHLYLLITVVALLSLAEAGARFSLDARRRGPRDSPFWPVRLLQVQVVVVYLFAALTKLNLDFVSGLVLAVNMRWDGPLAFPLALRNVAVLAPLSVLVIAMELLLAVGLAFQRVRSGAVVLGVLLHAGMFISTRPTLDLVLFAWMMWTLYLSFDPDLGAVGHAVRWRKRVPGWMAEPKVLGPA